MALKHLKKLKIMQTRGYNHEKGFYRILNNPKILKTNINENKKLKKIKKNSCEHTFIKTEINSQIMKNLKFLQSNVAPKVILKIHISKDIYDELKVAFELRGRFTENKNFEKEFITDTKRYFTGGRRPTIAEYFKFKITKFKDIETYDKELNFKKIPRNGLLSISFLRDNE